MDSWDKINEEYDMSEDDWIEWKKTKKQYKGRTYFTCQICGRKIGASPFIAFLIVKGKKTLICSFCKEK